MVDSCIVRSSLETLPLRTVLQPFEEGSSHGRLLSAPASLHLGEYPNRADEGTLSCSRSRPSGLPDDALRDARLVEVLA